MINRTAVISENLSNIMSQSMNIKVLVVVLVTVPAPCYTAKPPGDFASNIPAK